MSSDKAPDPLVEELRIAAERAGLPLTEEELVRLRPLYAQMVEQVRSLRELDLAEVEPALSFLPQRRAQREGR